MCPGDHQGTTIGVRELPGGKDHRKSHSHRRPHDLGTIVVDKGAAMILLTCKAQYVEQSVDECSERTNSTPTRLDRLVEVVRLAGVSSECSCKDEFPRLPSMG